MTATLMLALGLLAGAKAEEGPDRPFLHPLFSDHAVLQRDVPVPFRGWAEPGQRVKVALAGQSVETTADDKGRWVARLGPYPAGGPHVATVTGPGKAVEVKDLLIGDVWLCSGQSNMEWPLHRSDRGKEEVAAADHPRLRLLTVPQKTAFEPMATFEAAWDVCQPATAPDFSAVGYFFGRELRRELDVPIGLIDSTWGGTVAEAWTGAEALKALGGFDKALARVEAEKAERARPPVRFEQAMAAWWKKNDPGSADQPTWADPKFEPAGWKSMELPGKWEDRGLPDFDGIAWFRKDVEIPEAWAGKELTLTLGAIDDRDTTFVNGVEVGHMERWDARRKYAIPAELVKPGRMVIAVRVLDGQGEGGFAGPEGEMKLAPKGVDAAEPISLAGPWAFKDAARAADLTSPPEPNGQNPNVVAALSNGMIAPLTSFPIKGVIWYQGEGNAGRPAQYRRLLPALIRDWRARFDSGDFPFLIVQLANFMERKPQPGDSGWAELREAQYLAIKAVPNAALALAIDIGDAKDIHPTNKQEVGRRLALAALALTYGKPVESSGPVFKSMEIQGDAIRLNFDHVGGGLVARGGGTRLEGFAVAGEDGKFAWADATIDGETVVVTAPEIAKPIKVRYAWADNPACNLENKAGLPAVPFRTDPPGQD